MRSVADGRATLAALSFAAMSACAPYVIQKASDVPEWQLVYRHDADGQVVAGSKAELLGAIRRGSPIRIAWGVKVEREGRVRSVEHVADPVFASIVDGDHVVVQLPEHIAQRAYADIGGAVFDDAAVMWRGLMTTQGIFDAVWVNRATGEVVRRLPQRVGLAWFAFQPENSEARQPLLELAVPGGVRSADPASQR